jgi:hypothetical protein
MCRRPISFYFLMAFRTIKYKRAAFRGRSRFTRSISRRYNFRIFKFKKVSIAGFLKSVYGRLLAAIRVLPSGGRLAMVAPWSQAGASPS